MEERVIIIAEVGVNHNGSLDMAKRLIDIAADAGADYVKFQTFKAQNIASASAPMADYQKRNSVAEAGDQYSMLKKLELDENAHQKLIEHCNNRGTRFLSTGFDKESVDMLIKLKIPLLKIPSGEVTNKPYLQHIASKKLPTLLSTGMSTMEEVEAALNILLNGGLSRERITILHCSTEYPVHMKEVNLFAMKTIQNTFNTKVGYSDHTLGIEVPIAAVALGAKVIEKHFTLDKSMDGPDHKASIEPDELRQMVRAIRNIEMAISGNGEKLPSETEIRNRVAARKSLHYNRDVFKGNRIKEDDISCLRPGDGISPMEIEKIIGRILIGDFKKGQKINWDDLK